MERVLFGLIVVVTVLGALPWVLDTLGANWAVVVSVLLGAACLGYIERRGG